MTGTEAIIEEAFVDVFCDLVYGGGWIDMKRRISPGIVIGHW